MVEGRQLTKGSALMAGKSPAKGNVRKEAKLSLKEKRTLKKEKVDPLIKPRKGR